MKGQIEVLLSFMQRIVTSLIPANGIHKGFSISFGKRQAGNAPLVGEVFHPSEPSIYMGGNVYDSTRLPLKSILRVTASGGGGRITLLLP